MKVESLKKFYMAYKLYIFPAVVGVCCLILTVLVILPQTIKLVGNQRSEEENLNRFKILEAKAAELDNYDESDLRQKVQIALSVLPPDKDLAGATGFLQQIITQAGFIPSSIQIGGQVSPTVKGSSNQSYLINAQVSGSRSKINSLINSIENSGRMVKLSSIDISPGQGIEAVNISLGIEVLYFPFSSQAASIDAPLPKLTDKDQQLLAIFTQFNTIPSEADSTVTLSPRGKVNPFE